MYWGDVYPRSSYIILLPLFHEPIIVAFLQFTVIDRFKKNNLSIYTKFFEQHTVQKLALKLPDYKFSRSSSRTNEKTTNDKYWPRRQRIVHCLELSIQGSLKMSLLRIFSLWLDSRHLKNKMQDVLFEKKIILFTQKNDTRVLLGLIFKFSCFSKICRIFKCRLSGGVWGIFYGFQVYQKQKVPTDNFWNKNPFFIRK